MDALEQENDYLTKINCQLKRETEVVQWYVQVFEDGKDTKEIVGLYSKLRKEHTKLE